MDTAKRGAFAGGRSLLERSKLDQARLAWRLLRDPRVSALKYALPSLLLIYLMSPVDAVPDFLLGIGQTDDLGGAVIAFMMLIRVIPKLAPGHVVDDHLRDMSQGSQARQPETQRDDGAIDARFNVRS